MRTDVKDLISQMTLEEKAGLLSGSDFWHTKAVERLGIPAVMLSDGPHGLRKQEGESDHIFAGFLPGLLSYALFPLFSPQRTKAALFWPAFAGFWHFFCSPWHRRRR